MDWHDLFGPIGTEGTRRMRIVTGLIGALAGGGIGYLWWIAELGDPMSPVLTVLIGAALGGAFGALFSLLVVGALLAILAVAAIIAWQVVVKG
ncbi:MAG: hypothetical protein HLUCCA08_04120 [Rhodobacteraceae bacterium HLUCCA08]|nr:MAG: hypothetical protein HLUCCA08_04120 [Rhodobacteraceae bacterium HLUCCA08]